MSADWFRIPEWCAVAEDPSEVTAAVYLLGRWHLGRDPSRAELKRVTGWGWDKCDRFISRLRSWGEAAGARVPDEKRGKTGRRPEIAGRHDLDSSGIVEASRGETGSDRGASCTRDPCLGEREEREIQTGGVAHAGETGTSTPTVTATPTTTTTPQASGSATNAESAPEAGDRKPKPPKVAHPQDRRPPDAFTPTPTATVTPDDCDEDPAGPVTLPDGRTVPGDLAGLLPRLPQRDLLALARAPGIDGARALLGIPAGRLRYAGGIGEALAAKVEDHLRRQRIEPGCLAVAEELRPNGRAPPGPRRRPTIEDLLGHADEPPPRILLTPGDPRC